MKFFLHLIIILFYICNHVILKFTIKKHTMETTIEAQRIIDGNKLIAKFLGSKFINDSPDDYPNGYYYQPEGVEHDCPTGEPDWWCFNTSWDWLMPVVEKIEKTNFGTIDIKSHGVCFVSFNKKIESYYSGSLIENTWNAVISFLTWYMSFTMTIEDLEKKMI